MLPEVIWPHVTLAAIIAVVGLFVFAVDRTGRIKLRPESFCYLPGHIRSMFERTFQKALDELEREYKVAVKTSGSQPVGFRFQLDVKLADGRVITCTPVGILGNAYQSDGGAGTAT